LKSYHFGLLELICILDREYSIYCGGLLLFAIDLVVCN